jgi:signal transduction histidine kinase
MVVLRRDTAALCATLALYQQADTALAQALPDLHQRIQELRERADVAYTVTNLPDILSRSVEGLERIRQIVKDLRDFARGDEHQPQEVDLNAGIESTVNIVRGLAGNRGVEVRLELQSLPRMYCFPAKINQVVMNLLTNAIDACDQGGVVTIRTRPADRGVEVEVEDNGRGIDPVLRERIFDPFFTTKPQGQGMGLGLSISYGIVRDHDGRIEVQDAPGGGTRFTVFLPRRAAAGAQPVGD